MMMMMMMMKRGRKEHCAMVTRTKKLLGSRKKRPCRQQQRTLPSRRRRRRRQRGGGAKDFSSYSVPVMDMAGSMVGEYLADKLLAKLKRKKKQKGGGGALAKAIYNMDLAKGIRKLDSTVQTTNRLALGTLLGSLAAAGAYKVYHRRQMNRRQKGGGSNGWDKLFTW